MTQKLKKSAKLKKRKEKKNNEIYQRSRVTKSEVYVRVGGGDAVAHGGGSGGGEDNEQEDRSDRGGVQHTDVEFCSRERDTQRVRKNSEDTITLEEDMCSISDGRE
jgi:hypothetical protein